MVENNDVQEKIVIQQELEKRCRNCIKIIRSLAKYHVEDTEFFATIEVVERDGFGEL